MYGKYSTLKWCWKHHQPAIVIVTNKQKYLKTYFFALHVSIRYNWQILDIADVSVFIHKARKNNCTCYIF